jgi:hypothetical protein
MVDSPRSEIGTATEATAAAATAAATTAAATAKANSVKDRRCPYCQQQFTSSSLGRHFDQFIFRKKPDGIHDVDEIRRLRSSVTRRMTKGAIGTNHTSQEREDGSPSAYQPASHAIPLAPLDPTATEVRSDLNTLPLDGVRHQLNSLNWHATGVINGLPGLPGAAIAPALDDRLLGNGKRSYSSVETAAAKDMLGLRGAPPSDKETVRALELALREVLDTIHAAQ